MKGVKKSCLRITGQRHIHEQPTASYSELAGTGGAGRMVCGTAGEAMQSVGSDAVKIFSRNDGCIPARLAF
jgi:hypothetical protein